MPDTQWVVEVEQPKAAPETLSATCDAVARKDLVDALSRLDRGQIKASIKCAADAINRMSAEHGVHGWAGY